MMKMTRWSALAAIAASAAALAMPAAQPRFDIVEKTIDELSAAMAAGTITSRDLVQAYLARIDE